MKRIYSIMLCVLLGGLGVSAQIVLSEDFENGIPADWEIITLATDDGYTTGTDASSAYFDVPNHASGQVAFTNDDVCNCDKSNDWLITPSFDLTGLTTPTLFFDRAFGAFTNGGTETAAVEVSTDGGATWTVLSELVGDGVALGGGSVAVNWVDLESVDLTAFAGMTDVKIGFHYSDGAGWLYGLVIDNVTVLQQPEWEIKLSSLAIEGIHQGGEIVAISGEVANLGLNEITSFNLTWTDGVNSFDETISGVSIPSLGTYTFTASDAFTAVAASTSDITVTISSPNGNTDTDATNNELTTSVTGIAFIPVRRVVVEEATGTWCGWCPRGTVGMEYMTATYPETFIGIAMHNNDPMELAEYDSNNGISSYPSSNVDRVLTGQNPSSANLETVHNDRVDLIVAANIDDEVTYDPATREITVTVTSEFVAPVTDYRFNLVILEDSVTGTSSGFAQVNYYSAQSQNIDLFSLDGTNWKNLAATVPAADMYYDHVARALPVGYFGEAGSLPAVISAGDVLSHTFTYTLPAAYDENHIHVVSMLLDNASGEIVNAVTSAIEIPVANKNLTFNENLAKVFPNPFSDVTTVSLNLVDAANVSIEVYNTVGQLMGQQDFGKLSGEQNIPFNGTSLNDGVYFMHIIVGEQVVTKRVTIAK
jgi:hypothetical protein